MGDFVHILKVAALLEQSYRLTLVLQQAPAQGADFTACVTAELLEVLDQARVGLFVASGVARHEF